MLPAEESLSTRARKVGATGVTASVAARPSADPSISVHLPPNDTRRKTGAGRPSPTTSVRAVISIDTSQTSSPGAALRPPAPAAPGPDADPESGTQRSRYRRKSRSDLPGIRRERQAATLDGDFGVGDAGSSSDVLGGHAGWIGVSPARHGARAPRCHRREQRHRSGVKAVGNPDTSRNGHMFRALDVMEHMAIGLSAERRYELVAEYGCGFKRARRRRRDAQCRPHLRIHPAELRRSPAARGRCWRAGVQHRRVRTPLRSRKPAGSRSRA